MCLFGQAGAIDAALNNDVALHYSSGHMSLLYSESLQSTLPALAFNKEPCQFRVEFALIVCH